MINKVRWYSQIVKPYGSSVFWNACGETCLAMGISSVLNKEITPVDIIKRYGIPDKYDTLGELRFWSSGYGVPLNYVTRYSGYTSAKEDLDKGKPVLTLINYNHLMRYGYNSLRILSKGYLAGHFTLLVGYDDTGYYVHDPYYYSGGDYIHIPYSVYNQAWGDYAYSSLVFPALPEAVEYTPEPEEDNYILHTVKYGETFWSLSNFYYQNPLKWRDISEYNNISPLNLKAGAIIKVPV